MFRTCEGARISASLKPFQSSTRLGLTVVAGGLDTGFTGYVESRPDAADLGPYLKTLQTFTS